MPTDRELELRHAETEARELIERYGIQAPEDIRLEDIAFDLGITVTEGRLEMASARLAKLGNRAVVRLSELENYAQRRRFSLAHEIGHFQLHSNAGFFGCTERNLNEWGHRPNPEVEANVFASELLMPKSFVRRYCEVSPVDFRAVQKICTDFSVSLTAAAIRFVTYASEMCAVVCAEGGRVAWCKKSEDFWPFIKIGKPLGQKTLAYDFFKNGKTWPKPEGIEPENWLDSDRLGGVEEVIEHTIAAPNLGFTLSLLWIRSR